MPLGTGGTGATGGVEAAADVPDVCAWCRALHLDWTALRPVVGRALVAIADGSVDHRGLAAVAASLGVSDRHLHRLVVEATGTSPQQLAAARRTQAARALLVYTDLPVDAVGEAAGFSSERQHSAVLHARTGMPPGRLRRHLRGHALGAAPGRGRCGLRLRVLLTYEPPLHWEALAVLLGHQGSPGTARVVRYDGPDAPLATTLCLPHGAARAVVRPAAAGPRLLADLTLSDPMDLGAGIASVRRWLGLDVPVAAAERVLGRDPVAGRLLAARPGLRPPGALDEVSVVVTALLLEALPPHVARRGARLLLHGSGGAGAHGGTTSPASVLRRLAQPGVTGLDARAAREVGEVLRGLASGTPPRDVLQGHGAGAQAYARLRLDSDLTVLPPRTSGVARSTGAGTPASHAAAARVPQLQGLVWTHLWAAAAARETPRTVSDGDRPTRALRCRSWQS